jgi:hypothetical protein
MTRSLEVARAEEDVRRSPPVRPGETTCLRKNLLPFADFDILPFGYVLSAIMALRLF